MNTTCQINKINIVHLISSLEKKGPLNVLYDIVNNIDAKRFNVFVVALSEEKENSCCEYFSNINVSVYRLKSRKRYDFISYKVELRKYLSSICCDIIHSHCFRSLMLGELLSEEYIHLHTIHIYPGLMFRTINGKYKGYIGSLVYKYLIRKIKYPIACSESVAKEFKKKDNIAVYYICNGVSKNNVISDNKIQKRKKLGLDIESMYFVGVGRFSKEKNYIALVKAFNMINDSGIKMILLGDGVEYESLLSIKNNNILLPGFIKDISEYLVASDFFVSASKSEGMPISVLEAMSYGLPLLLSGIDPHLEVFDFTEDRLMGYIFNENNIDDIKSKMQDIIKRNDYEEMSLYIKSVYKKKFTAEMMANKYMSFYDHVFEVKDGKDIEV